MYKIYHIGKRNGKFFGKSPEIANQADCKEFTFIKSSTRLRCPR